MLLTFDFYPQHSITLVIHFEGELAEVQLEHRQVVHRAINDFLQSPVPFVAFEGTSFAPEDGFKPGHVQKPACSVNEPLIDFIQFAPALEKQIAAVFELVTGIGVTKVRTLLLFLVKRKTKAARLNPPLHPLSQTR
jgi:hypothetical protein